MLVSLRLDLQAEKVYIICFITLTSSAIIFYLFVARIITQYPAMLPVILWLALQTVSTENATVIDKENGNLPSAFIILWRREYAYTFILCSWSGNQICVKVKVNS